MKDDCSFIFKLDLRFNFSLFKFNYELMLSWYDHCYLLLIFFLAGQSTVIEFIIKVLRFNLVSF